MADKSIDKFKVLLANQKSCRKSRASSTETLKMSITMRAEFMFHCALIYHPLS